MIVGLVGGVAMASVAVARRTQSAFPRIIAASNPSNLDVDPGPYSARMLGQIAQLPRVRSAESYVALDFLRTLPSGFADPGTDFNQSVELTSQTTLRAGDSFQIQIQGTAARTATITVDQGETFDSLVTKINGQIGGIGKASVNYSGGGENLKIQVNAGKTISLVAGPKDFDALSRLGITAGVLTAPAKGSTSTTSTTKQAGVTPTWVGLACLRQGRLDEALEWFQRETHETFRLLGRTLLEHARGRSAESDALLHEMIEKNAAGAAYQIAEAYAYRGEANLAFEWLERAMSAPVLLEMSSGPVIPPVRPRP